VDETTKSRKDTKKEIAQSGRLGVMAQKSRDAIGVAA
jgi:hypothetical protein